MNVVLLEPEIPPNTGNIARLCAATNIHLHLIEPLGFKLDDESLKRAGLDYWPYVHLRIWKSWTEFQSHLSPKSRIWVVEQGAPKLYTQVQYKWGDYLIFGRESAGLPYNLIERYKEYWIRIPLFNHYVRSLNLSNCVAIVVYEALRQLGFLLEAKNEFQPHRK